jgi:hypothetical protein
VNILAWIGVGIGAMLVLGWLLVGIGGMLSSPIGRSILVCWTILGIAVWGVIGGIYLIAEAI